MSLFYIKIKLNINCIIWKTRNSRLEPTHLNSNNEKRYKQKLNNFSKLCY